MEDWSKRETGDTEGPWRECNIVAVAQSLVQDITCQTLPRGVMFRGLLFSERMAEVRRRFTNLEELVLELPLCEEYQEQYGPACCAAMVNLDNPERCTALDEAIAVLRQAASAAALKKYRMWRMGVYD